MWNDEIVKARFVEAADTERRLPNRKLSTASGYWPTYNYENDDMRGWDQQARDDHLEKVAGRKPATSGQVTRHEECLNWTINLISLEERRKLVWAWAFCKANDRDFGKECQRRGWARPTAYRRLTAVFNSIADQLRNNNVMLRMPADRWARQESQDRVDECVTIKNSARAVPLHTPSFFISEKSKDMLTTPKAVAAFVAHVENVNDNRRKALIRRFVHAVDA